MRVALYARVSTADKHQDPELQLVPMRAHCERQGWEVVEFVDHASAGDLAGRKAWREMQTVIKLGYIDLVMVWALDRAFRSSLAWHSSLEKWVKGGVGFASLTQPFDTTRPEGRLMADMLAAFAEFEREQIRTRVKEGLVNARRKGSRLGRPPVTDRPGFAQEFTSVSAELRAGRLSKRAAAARLNVGPATLDRLLTKAPKPRGRPKTGGQEPPADTPAEAA